MLDKTRFAAISAEFTICTANLITLVLSVERLFAVAQCPFLCRRKSSVKRSVIILSFEVLYPLSVSLASFSGSRWRDRPLHAHMIITTPMVTLISVNIALVVALRRQNKQAKILLGSSESTPSGFRESEAKRKERENSLCVTTQLVVSFFVSSPLPIIFLRDSLFPRVSRRKMAFRGHPFLFAICILESSHEFSHIKLQTQARPPFIQTRFYVYLTDSSTRYSTYPFCEVNGLPLTEV